MTDEATPTAPAPLAIREGDFFVGRSRELAAALAAWRSCLASESWHSVLIGGDAGAGKTRLAAEVVDRLGPDSPTILYGRCDEELAVPYLAVAEALGDLLRSQPTGDLSADLDPLLRNLPTFSRQPLDARRDVDRLALFEAVAAALSAAAATSPVIVVLDDLQWADQPTLQMLRRLLRGRRSGRVLVVGTHRADELATRVEVANLLADLRDEPAVLRIRLDGLDVPTAIRFVEAAAGHDLDPPAVDLAHELRARSGGNPFFMGQLLRDLVDAGGVHLVQGRWQVRGSVNDLPLPDGVREVIDRRVGRLSALAQDALAAAAVVGPVFPFELVRDLLPEHGGDELLGAVEEAAGAHLADERAWGTFAFAHGLIRDTLLAGLGPTRRARLHRRVAEILEAGADAPSNIEAIASHYAAAVATDPVLLGPRAARHGLAAGTVALARLAHEDAVVHLERALVALAASGRSEPTLRAELLLALGDALERSGDAAALVGVAEEAAEQAKAASRPDLVAMAALLVATPGMVSIGQPNPLLDRLSSDALALLGPDEDDLRAQLLAAQARYLVAIGDASRAVEVGRQAVAFAREGASQDGFESALGALGSALEATPATEERRRVVEHLLTLSNQDSDVRSIATLHYMRLRLLLELGERDLLRAAVDEADRDGSARRSWGARAAAAAYRTGLALLDGSFDDVEALAADVLAHGGDDPDAFNSWSGLTAILYREQGRLGDLADHFERELRRQPGVVSYRAALALLHAEEGRLPVARRHLESLAADGFASVPEDPTHQGTLAMVAEVVALVGEPALAAPVVARLAPYRGLFVDLAGSGGCLGPVDRYLGMLAATTGSFDEADGHFAAATAMDERIASPPMLARTKCWHARMLLLRGATADASTATALAEQCRAAAAQYGMVRLEATAGELTSGGRRATR